MLLSTLHKINKLFVLLIALVLIGPVWAAGTAGLIYETYAGTGATPSRDPLANPTVRSTGTSANINYPLGSFGTNILGSGLIDRVIVKWTGWINLPAGTYKFGGNVDDGVYATIDGTVVLDSWVDAGFSFREGTPITVSGGPKPITVWYYENGGGQGIVFQWLVDGVWQVVPASVFATDPTYFAPVVAPTPVYGNTAITNAQATKRSNDLSQTTGHNAQVEITGDGNDVYILQAGGGHYAGVAITGNTNTVNLTQTTLVGARHYTDLTIIGSSNNLTLLQSGNDKTQVINVNGDHNTISTSQTGTGNHFLDLSVSGNNHTASVSQDGSGNHNARVSLDGNQPWNFNLTQQGSTSKQYSLPHSMSDGSTVSGTCNAIGGCNLTVNQQ